MVYEENYKHTKIRREDDDGRLMYSVADVARILGLTRNTIYALCTRGRIPYVRVGRSLLIPKHQLQKLIDNVEKPKGVV